MLAILLAVLAGAYILTARAVRAGGRRWPYLRTLSFVAGSVAIAVAFLPPVATHDENFKVHVAQHLLLAMLGPVLLALSAPVTLILVSLRGNRRALTGVLHSRTLRLLAHPVVLERAPARACHGTHGPKKSRARSRRSFRPPH